MHSDGVGQVRVDFAAAAASVLAVFMLFVYLTVIRQQDGQPAVWAAAMLVLGAAGAGYGAFSDAPYRRAALLSAGCGLAALGPLAVVTNRRANSPGQRALSRGRSQTAASHDVKTSLACL